MSTKISDAEINKMKELYEKGYSAASICKVVGYTPHTILDRLRSKGVQIRSKAGYIKPFNENYFETIDTEKKAYFLGFLMADGCIKTRECQPCITMQLKSTDKYILEELKAELNTDNIIEYNKKRDHSTLRVHSQKMADDLEKYGIVPRKTGQEKLPLELLPDDMVRHFIRGFFDGDGWITLTSSHGKPNRRLGIGFAGNVDMLTDIKNYFVEKLQGSFNANPYIYNDRAKGYDGFSELIFYKLSDCVKICEWLYKDATVFLTRKRDIFINASLLISSRLNQQSA